MVWRGSFEDIGRRKRDRTEDLHCGWLRNTQISLDGEEYSPHHSPTAWVGLHEAVEAGLPCGTEPGLPPT